MGKSKKIKAKGKVKNLPLDLQIHNDERASTSYKNTKIRFRQDEDEAFVDGKLSKKILNEARKQQQELEEECGPSKPKTFSTNLGSKDDDDSPESCDEESDIDDVCYEDIDIDEADEAAFKQFMSHDEPMRRTLGDIIMEKITEKKTEIQSQFSDSGSIGMPEIDERIVEMYKGVGQILSRYRSGKLPKAFKVIPTLKNWEHLMALTSPQLWSAAAVYQATRIFSANLGERFSQKFYNLLLLPRIRDDIDEYKKLNFHLYQALRKSLFRPGAFFKGIILPLCESGTCTLREAVIIGSVISNFSIPVLQSSAAILKLAEMDYSGANSIFLRLLFDKKYALPYRVVDAVVHHFLRFRFEKRQLPVLWHLSLLTFVQRYKEDLSQDQKDELMDLLRHQNHAKITPEIRRELVNSKCREPASESMST